MVAAGARVALRSHALCCDDVRRGVVGDSESAPSEATDATVRGALVCRADAPPHERIGRYLVLGTLGAGAMGRVLRAYDPKLRREVALKLVHGFRDAPTRRQVMQEARAMAQLSHPNIVAVFDVEQEGATPFIAMEYVEGGTLRDWMDEGPHPWPVILAALTEAARGLEAAHAADLVHRDFKPQNVMRRKDGRLQVADFGIAAAPDAEDTDDGGTAGTPAYMAPEQHRGRAADARSDQYALCVVLWEAICGRRPFHPIDLLENKLNLRFDKGPTSGAMPGFVRDLLIRGLDPDPRKRHASVGALMAALHRDPRRWRRPVLGALVLAALGGSAMAVRWHNDVDAKRACADEGDRVRQVWNAQVRQAVATAFSGADVHNADSVFERTVPWIDTFADAWSGARTEQCLAVHERGVAGPLDEQGAVCFEEQRMQLEALLEILQRPDARAMQRAVKAAAGMPDPLACVDETALRQRAALPEDPQTLQALAALREERSVVAAQLATGRAKGVVEKTEAMMTRARQAGWAPETVNVLLLLAEAREYAGDYEAAAIAAVEAFNLALATGYDAGALSACARLAYVVGYGQEQHAAGLQWSAAGDAIATRLGYGEHHPRRLALLNNTAVLDWARGEFELSKQGHRAALQAKRNALGPEHPGLVTTLDNLGITLASMGEVDAAQDAFSESFELAVRTLGDDHPVVASVLVKLGTLAAQRGDGAQARMYLDKALPRMEAALGADHADVALVLVNLAMALLEDDEPELGLRRATRAYEMLERPSGEPHPYRAAAAFAVGRAHELRFRFDQAQPFFEEAARLRRSSLPASHPDRIESELRLGHVRFARAKALLGTDGAQANVLAQAALDGVSGIEESDDFAREIRDWLAANAP